MSYPYPPRYPLYSLPHYYSSSPQLPLPFVSHFDSHLTPSPFNSLYKNDLPRSPSLSPDNSSNNSWGDVLDDSSDSSPHSLPPFVPSSPSASVKEEPDDLPGPFIMELSVPQVQSTFLSQSLAPPTEVPLRATQAPPKMRSMMGVFRLNPFAMHSGEGRGVVAPTWCGEEARPLDEEPIIFEFQIDLEDAFPQIPEQPKEPLRSFSPDFELHQELRDDHDQNNWQEYHSESAYTSTPPTWDLDYPQSDEHFVSASEPTSSPLQASHSSRLYEISQHYLHKNAEHSGYMAACYPSSTSTMASAINAHRMRPLETSWSRTGYVPASRSTVYASDSPGCHSAVLPSINSANRRWSLPDSNSNYHAPFLG